MGHKGHYGEYTGNAKHSRVTNSNMAATKRDDEAHMEYLKDDIDYDNKHGHSDSSMTSDEKHISKLAGDLKYDEKHHGSAARMVSPLNDEGKGNMIKTLVDKDLKPVLPKATNESPKKAIERPPNESFKRQPIKTEGAPNLMVSPLNRSVEKLKQIKSDMQENRDDKKMGVKRYNKKVGRLNKKIKRKEQ